MQTDHAAPADRHAHATTVRGAVSLLVLFVALAGLAAGLVMASRYYEGCKGAADGPSRDVTFTVADGATAEQVVDDLAAEGVIPCGGFVGNLLMRGTGKSGEIRAGTYPLTTGHDPRRGGRRCSPRPRRRCPTAERADPARLPPHPDRRRGRGVARASPPRSSSTSRQGEVRSARSSARRDAPLEGFLWPETYRIPKGDDADAVIQRLLDQFAEETEGACRGRTRRPSASRPTRSW